MRSEPRNVKRVRKHPLLTLDTGRRIWYNIMKYFSQKGVFPMKIIPRILLAVLSVLLAVLLCLTGLFSAVVYSVRSLYTPEYVYNLMNSLDYAALEVPDGNGNTAALCDIVNEQVHDFGISFTEKDLNSAIRSFSIDAVITSFVQDLRTWLLDDGPVPVLNPDEVAGAILSGFDQNLLAFASYFGDPQALLSNALDGLTGAADLSDTLKSAEPVRELLSAGTLSFALSVCGTLFLLILMTRRLKLVPTMVLTGSAGIVSGTVLLFAETLLTPVKMQMISDSGMPASTLNIIWQPLMEAFHRMGTFLALGSLTLVIVFAVIGALSSMIRREKAAAEEAAARRVHAYAGYDMPNAANMNIPRENSTPTQNGGNRNDSNNRSDY